MLIAHTGKSRGMALRWISNHWDWKKGKPPRNMQEMKEKHENFKIPKMIRIRQFGEKYPKILEKKF